jgi:hypothetical protein
VILKILVFLQEQLTRIFESKFGNIANIKKKKIKNRTESESVLVILEQFEKQKIIKKLS